MKIKMPGNAESPATISETSLSNLVKGAIAVFDAGGYSEIMLADGRVLQETEIRYLAHRWGIPGGRMMQ